MLMFSVKIYTTLPRHVHFFGENMHYFTQTSRCFWWKHTLFHPNKSIFLMKIVATLAKHNILCTHT